MRPRVCVCVRERERERDARVCVSNLCSGTGFSRLFVCVCVFFFFFIPFGRLRSEGLCCLRRSLSRVNCQQANRSTGQLANRSTATGHQYSSLPPPYFNPILTLTFNASLSAIPEDPPLALHTYNVNIHTYIYIIWKLPSWFNNSKLCRNKR